MNEDKFLNKLSPVYRQMDQLHAATQPIREANEAKAKQQAEEAEARKEKLSSVIAELLGIFEQKPRDRVTVSGDGRFGLAEEERGVVSLYVLNKETDYTAYFQYKIMEHHAYFQVNHQGKILHIRIYDIQAMHQDEGSEYRHPDYATDFYFSVDGMPQFDNVDELIEKIEPLLEAYKWSLSTDPKLNKHYQEKTSAT